VNGRGSRRARTWRKSSARDGIVSLDVVVSSAESAGWWVARRLRALRISCAEESCSFQRRQVRRSDQTSKGCRSSKIWITSSIGSRLRGSHVLDIMFLTRCRPCLFLMTVRSRLARLVEGQQCEKWIKYLLGVLRCIALVLWQIEVGLSQAAGHFV
jgi:hypothetical protein